LSNQKAAYIKGVISQIVRDFGRATLQPLALYTTEQAEDYLTALPGVGVKTARCVLMYAFHRDVFPSDVNCLRIMERLGWLDWSGARAELMANEAQSLAPPSPSS